MKKIISAILLSVLCLGCVFALASCGKPNKDPETAKKALEADKYVVDLYKDKEVDDKVEAVVQAYTEDLENVITITYYKDKADAKDAYKDMKENVEKLEKYYKDSGFNVELEMGRSGAMVWIGTKDAIKAAKK